MLKEKGAVGIGRTVGRLTDEIHECSERINVKRRAVDLALFDKRSQLIVPIIVSIIRVLAVSGRMTAPLNSFYGYRIVFKGENNEKTEQS